MGSLPPSAPKDWAPRARLGLFLAASALLGAGCSTSFDGNTYRNKQVAFRIGPTPPAWQRLPASHAELAFRDPQNEATVAVNARCGSDGDDIPLSALTQHLFMRFTDRNVESERVVPFDGREALHSVVVAKLDGVPFKFDVWVLKKDGCVYDLYYMAPPSRFDRGVGEFGRFVKGFGTVPRHAE
jgi:hypothetical protein